MYIRTTNHKRKDGSVVRYLQIAENVWDPERKFSTTRVLCSLGRADDRAVERLRQLLASAKRYAEAEDLSLVEGDLTFVESWHYGAIYVLEQLWERLGIREVIRSALSEEDRTVPLEPALFVMVANRCLDPTSKLGCWQRWLAEEVWYPPGQEVELHHLYRAMDYLAEHKEQIEEELYWRLADLLSLDVDLIFYDTTSVGFSVDEEDEFRRRGYERGGSEKWPPQVVVGMAMSRDGYPVRSWVFEGNTADVDTIERVKEELRGWRLNRCVWVSDAGMVSEANLKALSAGGGRYIVAMPARRGTEVVKEVLSRPGRYRTVAENLRVKEVQVGNRRYVVCHNPREAERQHQHREEVVAELEAELSTLQGHPKRACQLFSSRRFGPYLRQLKSGEVRIDRAAIERRRRRDGIWVLQTNDRELSAEDLALGYKQLMRVEQAWRTMKSGLRIEPVYHRTPERIRAHIYLCVLSLLLERVTEAACNQTWARIRHSLASIKVAQLFGENGTVYQASPGKNNARNLLKKLKIDPPRRLQAVE